MKILCYYHAVDPDGWFSGALVKFFELFKDPDADIVLRSWTYSRDNPKVSKLKGFDKLYLVDLHWNDDLMKEAYDLYQDNFIWIDHHSSSIEEFYAKFPDIKIRGIQDITYSAARNVWLYFKKEFEDASLKCPMIEAHLNVSSQAVISSTYSELGVVSKEDQEIPIWLYMLSEYDAWRRASDEIFWSTYMYNYEIWLKYRFHNAEEAYAYVCSYLESIVIPNKIGTYFVVDFEESLKTGKLLETYQQSCDDRDAKVAGWSQKLTADDGTVYSAYLINTQRRGSSIFKNVNGFSSYDLLIPFYRDKTKWNYSAYTTKDEVYLPGIKFKGVKFNGHAKAAGCQSEEFLFDRQ